MQLISSVREFQKKFKLPMPGSPTWPSREYVDYRLNHIDEEFLELRKAIVDRDMAKALDAMVDMIYVTIGFAVNCGFPISKAFSLVHAANMRKVLADNVVDAIRNFKKYVTKPAGWASPDIEGLFNGRGSKYSFYVASGWFNDEQASDLQLILEVLQKNSMSFYSPRDEMECKPDATLDRQQEVFDANVEAIRQSDALIVNTRGKDMGSVFEAGVAHALGKPIIYFCRDLKGAFNLMLARSGVAVCSSESELSEAVLQLVNGATQIKSFTGRVE